MDHYLHGIFTRDPIIKETLDVCELKWENLKWNYDPLNSSDDNSQHVCMKIVLKNVEVFSYVTINLTDEGEAEICWYQSGSDKISQKARYNLEKNETEGIVTIPKTEMPDIMLDAVKGKDLSEVVKLPGSNKVEILSAVNSSTFIGDKLDLRILCKPKEKQ